MHTHTHAAGQPILRLIHNSSSCQSQATTGCLLLLLEQYIKTQRARHLLPLSLRILSLHVSLPHPPFIRPAFFLSLSFFPPTPLSLPLLFLLAALPPFLPAVYFAAPVIFPSFNSLNALIQTTVSVCLHVCFCVHESPPPPYAHTAAHTHRQAVLGACECCIV